MLVQLQNTFLSNYIISFVFKKHIIPFWKHAKTHNMRFIIIPFVFWEVTKAQKETVQHYYLQHTKMSVISLFLNG